MSNEKRARERVVQQRQHDEHLQELMLNRAEAEVNNPSNAEAVTQEQARELLTQQRQHDEHLQESMLNRAEAEIGISNRPSAQE
jgi:multidrug efflux pump subunit AcrA (membrane-fusion protein)